MFKIPKIREEEPMEWINIGNKAAYVNCDIANYVKSLEKSCENLRSDINRLSAELSKTKNELDFVKPIVTSKNYKPAISRDCGGCKYVVKSSYSRDIIGCRRDIVCCDYEPVDN